MAKSNSIKLKNKEYINASRAIVIKKGDYTIVKEFEHPFYDIGKHIRKLDAEHYLDKDTGEVKEYKKAKSRGLSKQSLNRTLNRIYDAILTNCSEKYQNRITFITLTFGDEVIDHKIAGKEFDRFSKCLKRYSQKNFKETYEYICIIEPQVRGTWHFHLLLIWSAKAPFIDNKVVETLWKKGYTKTTGVRYSTAKKLADYLTAHIRNMEISEYEAMEQMKLTDDMIEEIWWLSETYGKAVPVDIVKEGRISLYPCDVKIVRMSRGIKKPKKKAVPVRELNAVKEKAGEMQDSSVIAVLPHGILPQEYETEEECAADAVQLMKVSMFKKKKRPVHDINYASLQKLYNGQTKK